MWWRRLAEVQTEHQNGEERGFKWLNVEWLLVPDGLVWVTISRIYREWSEKEKISSERQLCERKCLVDVRGQRVPLLSAKNRKQRLQFTQTDQNWTIEDCKNVAWSDESWFLLQNSDVGSEFGVKDMKAWIHPALSQRFRLVVVVV